MPDEFFKQLTAYMADFGLLFVVLTLVIGVGIGYAFHFFMNELPMRKTRKREEEQALLNTTEQEEDETIRENAGRFNAELFQSIRKKEAQNEEMPKSSLRPTPPHSDEKHVHGFKETVKVIEKQDDNDDADGSDDEMEELEETEDIGADGEEGRDLVETLGTLHGKLATAQLRVRAKKMREEMSEEEKDSEAQIRAQQLQSIMSMMMENQEKFGMTSADEINEQLKMYSF